MSKHHANYPFERYANDVIVYYHSLQAAEQFLEEIRQRMEDCGLTLHPEKTKIVKCEKWGSDDEHPNKSFYFLGYRFEPCKASTKEGGNRNVFTGYQQQSCKADTNKAERAKCLKIPAKR